MSARALLGVALLGAAWFGRPADAAAQTPTPAPTSTSAPDDAALRAAIERRFRNEPTVHDVVRAGLERADLDPRRARRNARRSRRAAFVPDLRASVERRRGIDATDESTTSAQTSEVDRADAWRVEAALTLPLSRAVHAPDELAWAREERALADARREFVEHLVGLYFRRRRLVVEVELLHDLDPDKLAALAEVEALLEVFTGVSFSRIMVGPNGPP